MNFFEDTQKIMLSIKLNFTYLKRNNKKLKSEFFVYFSPFLVHFATEPWCINENITNASGMNIWLICSTIMTKNNKKIVFLQFFMIHLFYSLEKGPTKK